MACMRLARALTSPDDLGPFDGLDEARVRVGAVCACARSEPRAHEQIGLFVGDRVDVGEELHELAQACGRVDEHGRSAAPLLMDLLAVERSEQLARDLARDLTGSHCCIFRTASFARSSACSSSS